MVLMLYILLSNEKKLLKIVNFKVCDQNWKVEMEVFPQILCLLTSLCVGAKQGYCSLSVCVCVCVCVVPFLEK